MYSPFANVVGPSPYTHALRDKLYRPQHGTSTSMMPQLLPTMVPYPGFPKLLQFLFQAIAHAEYERNSIKSTRIVQSRPQRTEHTRKEKGPAAEEVEGRST